MEDELLLDLTRNILSRVPVDSLLRFRCLSKSYYAEIDDPKFIKTHLERSLKTDSNLGMLFQHVNPDYLSFISSFDSPDRVVKLDYPSKMDDFLSEENVWMIGSCNGLFCFYNEMGRLALINPSTRKFQILPFLPKEADLKAWSFGFGYDRITDDYKVVRLTQYRVYNMKSNSWRPIVGMPYFLSDKPYLSTLLGDALHWSVDRKRFLSAPKLIVAFNLGTEKFTEVPMPQLGPDDQDPSLILLGTVGMCLMLFANYPMEGKIWVLKEYGVKESWTLVASLPTPTPGSRRILLDRTIFSNNGDEFLLGFEGDYFVWYDLKAKTTKLRGMLPADLGGFETCAEIFHGSLVPLNDNTEKANSKKRPAGSEGNKKDSKKRDGFLSEGFKLKL